MYSPSEVRKLLKINNSTLRKYAILLEEHGYPIQRNSRGHRAFLDKDVEALRKLMEFSKQEGKTSELSVEAVVMCFAEESKTDITAKTIQIMNDRDNQEDCPHKESLEKSVETEMEKISEESDPNTTASSAQTMSGQNIVSNSSLHELSDRIEHLEQINVELIKLLKEKAVREAYQEEKINKILKHVERTEQLLASKMMEEETRRQVAASYQKKWWQWWK